MLEEYIIMRYIIHFILLILFFLPANFGCAIEPIKSNDKISQLINQLQSENENARNMAGKALFDIAKPVMDVIKDKYVDEKLWSEILKSVDWNVRKAAKALAEGDHQSNKYIFIFQAYYYPGSKFAPDTQFPDPSQSSSGMLDFRKLHEEYKLLKLYGTPPDNYTGVWRTWYKNGNKCIERNYKYGKPHGKWIQWHKNGQKRGEANYKNGKLHGKSTEFYERGQKHREIHFKNGEVYTDTIWDENGKPIEKKYYKKGKLIKTNN